MKVDFNLTLLNFKASLNTPLQKGARLQFPKVKLGHITVGEIGPKPKSKDRTLKLCVLLIPYIHEVI